MTKIFTLVFDTVMIKQLRSIDNTVKPFFSKIFDKLETIGPRAGTVIDSQ